MKLATTVALAIGLCGCANTLKSTTDVQAELGSRYRGAPAENFFRNNGLPMGAMATSSGGTIYQWRSDVVVTQMPVTATTRVVGNQAFTNFSGGQTREQFCAIQIEANKSGNVVSVRIMADTIGMMTLSRCVEVVR